MSGVTANGGFNVDLEPARVESCPAHTPFSFQYLYCQVRVVHPFCMLHIPRILRLLVISSVSEEYSHPWHRRLVFC